MMEETPRATLRDVDPSTLWVTYGFNPTGRTNGNRVAPEGYAYMFPKRDYVNVGLGYLLSYFRQEVEQAPYELQRSFVDRLRSRNIVVGDSVRTNFTPFLIPIGGPLPKPGRGRVLLAGEPSKTTN